MSNYQLYPKLVKLYPTTRDFMMRKNILKLSGINTWLSGNDVDWTANEWRGARLFDDYLYRRWPAKTFEANFFKNITFELGKKKNSIMRNLVDFDVEILFDLKWVKVRHRFLAPGAVQPILHRWRIYPHSRKDAVVKKTEIQNLTKNDGTSIIVTWRPEWQSSVVTRVITSSNS